MSTLVAVETEEAVCKHAAAEEGAELLLDEARGRLTSQCPAREEAFQLFAHDLVKKSLLWLMAPVLGHDVPDRDRRGWSAETEARPDRLRWLGWDARSGRVRLN